MGIEITGADWMIIIALVGVGIASVVALAESFKR